MTNKSKKIKSKLKKKERKTIKSINSKKSIKSKKSINSIKSIKSKKESLSNDEILKNPNDLEELIKISGKVMNETKEFMNFYYNDLLNKNKNNSKFEKCLEFSKNTNNFPNSIFNNSLLNVLNYCDTDCGYNNKEYNIKFQELLKKKLTKKEYELLQNIGKKQLEKDKMELINSKKNNISKKFNTFSNNFTKKEIEEFKKKGLLSACNSY